MIDETTYRANPCLKRCGVPIDYTEEQLTEYIKCSQDPIYFVENYMTIIHVDKGVVPFKLWDFQKELLLAIHNNRRVVAKVARQSGKCAEYNTKLKLRNKRTGEILETTIGNFYNLTKENSQDNI